MRFVLSDLLDLERMLGWNYVVLDLIVLVFLEMLMTGV